MSLRRDLKDRQETMALKPGGVAQLAECWPASHELLGSIFTAQRAGVEVAHTWGVEAGRPEV